MQGISADCGRIQAAPGQKSHRVSFAKPFNNKHLRLGLPDGNCHWQEAKKYAAPIIHCRLPTSKRKPILPVPGRIAQGPERRSTYDSQKTQHDAHEQESANADQRRPPGNPPVCIDDVTRNRISHAASPGPCPVDGLVSLGHGACPSGISREPAPVRPSPDPGR